MLTTLYPWQEQQWQQIRRYISAEKIPHALLLSGTAGLGKLAFAYYVAHTLLCEQRDANLNYCGHCRSCLLFQADTHPDFYCLSAEENSVIKIDSVRQLQEWVVTTRHLASHKIVIIEPAEALNQASANGLLKVLEEPPANVLFMLVSHHASRLIPTLRSRCQWLPFFPDYSTATVNWLQQQLPELTQPELLLRQAAGAPLKVLAMHQGDYLAQQNKLYLALSQVKDPWHLAANVENIELELLLNWMIVWVYNLIKYKFNSHLVEQNFSTQYKLAALVNHYHLHSLFHYLDKLYLAQKHVANKANLNRQLLLEELFASWITMSTTRS